jgi:nucleoside phosphorylase
VGATIAALASNHFAIPSASTFLSAADSPAERTRRYVRAICSWRKTFPIPKLLDSAPVTSIISRVGKLVTVDRVIEGEAERARLVRDHGAAAIDMETEWVGRACTAKNIPMLSLRAISDTAAAPFPAPPNVLFDLERQQTSAARLARHLFTHPSGVVRLMRFARQIALARASLATALKTLVESLD